MSLDSNKLQNAIEFKRALDSADNPVQTGVVVSTILGILSSDIKPEVFKDAVDKGIERLDALKAQAKAVIEAAGKKG